MAALESNDIKLIVLDVMLPDGSGLEICRNLRAENSHVPIILLTALKEDADRIIGLELGADDYLGKPFNPRELAARIGAILRRANNRSKGSVPDELSVGPITLNTGTHRVHVGGNAVPLTGAEFRVLELL